MTPPPSDSGKSRYSMLKARLEKGKVAIYAALEGDAGGDDISQMFDDALMAITSLESELSARARVAEAIQTHIERLRGHADNIYDGDYDHDIPAIHVANHLREAADALAASAERIKALETLLGAAEQHLMTPNYDLRRRILSALSLPAESASPEKEQIGDLPTRDDYPR